MKRLGLVTIVLLLAIVSVALVKAQNGSSSPAPTAAQQAEFAKVFADAQATEKSWSEISSPCNAALLRAQNANAQMNAVVFRIMAQMKLSPDEWEAKITEGKLSFAPKPKEAPKTGG